MTDTDKIRQLNDAFRTSFKGGKVMLTLGIRSKADYEVNTILEHVLNFHDFNKSNDPYCEHDCASFDYNGERIIWKIDYYDKDYRYMSKNPADPTITNRVLTIMTGEEY